MNYPEQVAAFNWQRWELYRKAQAEGLSTTAIACSYGTTACKVRRLLADGARLDWWRTRYAQG